MSDTAVARGAAFEKLWKYVPTDVLPKIKQLMMKAEQEAEAALKKAYEHKEAAGGYSRSVEHYVEAMEIRVKAMRDLKDETLQLAAILTEDMPNDAAQAICSMMLQKYKAFIQEYRAAEALNASVRDAAGKAMVEIRDAREESARAANWKRAAGFLAFASSVILGPVGAMAGWSTFVGSCVVADKTAAEVERELDAMGRALEMHKTRAQELLKEMSGLHDTIRTAIHTHVCSRFGMCACVTL